MTTGQKRDAGMDRLLRAMLKPSPREPDAACPDAEALAALVEGRLTAHEESALDSHIAACGRCQETIAILSHDLPEEQNGRAVASEESGWFTWVTRPRLRWLVPISAAATVAVVFFATRPLIAPDRGPSRAEVSQMAQAPAAPAPMPEAGLEALRERSAPEKREPAGAGGGDEAPKTLAGQPAASRVVPGATIGAPAADQAERDKKAAGPGAGMAAARVVSEEKPAPAEAPAAAPPPAAGARLAVAQQAADVPVAADEARKQPVAETDRAILVGSLRKDARSLEAGLLVVSAPGGNVQWKFGTGGRLSRSGDAGMTWHEQASGVTADLLAGAAPAPATCWIVGAGGTVLLTTDGERWERRPFPETVDLVSVAAAGSRAAVVTARDGRRFETLDAGLTWSIRH